MIKKSSLVLIAMCLCIHVWAKDVYVEGYTRSDGTVVKDHYRTSPDSTVNNNFSTKGNVNPYTGEPGWIDREHTKPGYTYPTSTYSSSMSSNTVYGSDNKLTKETRRYKRVDSDTLFIAGTLALLLILPLALFVFQFLKGPTLWMKTYHGKITLSILTRTSYAVFSVMIIAYLASYGPL